MARLLITGTRHGWDGVELARVLHHHYDALGGGPDIILVHGAADGVDSQAAGIWLDQGLLVEPHAADWSHGKRGGPERNTLMVTLGADQCIAFLTHNSSGTLDCMLKASAAGIPTQVYGRLS